MRERNIHAVEPREYGEREHRDGEHREHPDNAVRFVLDPTLERFVESVDDFLISLEEFPLPFDRIQNVIEVHIQSLIQKPLALVFESSNKRALWEQDATHGDDVALKLQECSEHFDFALFLKQDRFERPELPCDSIHKREAGFEEFINETVEKVSRSLTHNLLLTLFIFVEPRPEIIEYIEITFVESHHVVLSHEDVDFLLDDAMSFLVEVRNVEYEEEVVLVLINFGSLVLALAVLDIEIVKLKLFLERFECLRGGSG